MNFRKSDYESYDYSKFWEDDRRSYEDKAERIALRRLIAGAERKDRIFFDIGCGYGRLFNEYMDFGTIILVDYSLNNLKNARDRIERFLKNTPEKLASVYFVAADATSLPVKPNCADTILTVRVIHHLDNPEKFFNEITRVLKHEGLFFLEFANKRNLKNILRFFAGKMDASPFNLKSSQVGETILNFHPDYISDLLKKRSFMIKKSISVSNFRLNLLKKFPGTKTLLFFEKVYQRFFSWALLSPSIFLKSVLNKTGSGDTGRNKMTSLEDILICPYCGKDSLIFDENKVKCKNCGRIFIREDGIYDFKMKD